MGIPPDHYVGIYLGSPDHTRPRTAESFPLSVLRAAGSVVRGIIWIVVITEPNDRGILQDSLYFSFLAASGVSDRDQAAELTNLILRELERFSVRVDENRGFGVMGA